MVNPDLVAAKLSELADRVSRVRARVTPSAQELAADRDALELVAFNLMLAVQICADIASHVIADEGWPAARNLAEGFDRLRANGVIEAAVAAELMKAVGLRNVVAHGYAGLDVAKVHAAATAGVADLDRFATQVSAWIRPKQ